MKPFHQVKTAPTMHHSSKLDFPVHMHEALELVWLRQGSCCVITPDGRFSMDAGKFFVSFPQQLHGYDSSCDADAIVWIIPVTPYLENCQNILQNYLPETAVFSPDSTGVTDLLSMAMADSKTASANVMQGYIHLIVSKILDAISLKPAEPGSMDALQSVLLYLNDHYQEPLTRQEIADAVGYNASYISHIFDDSLHTTLTDYLSTLRMRDAKNMLKNTNLPVSRIALDLGFGSIRSFNRIFLNKTGCSPSQFRKND